MAHRGLLMLFLFLASGCESSPTANPHVSAAVALTLRYSQSPLAVWKIRGRAAGTDCAALLVETSVVMNDSMVEAIHYGAGGYGVVDGGVQRFYRDRAFRGVAYKDSAGHVWHYGELSGEEAKMLKPCVLPRRWPAASFASRPPPRAEWRNAQLYFCFRGPIAARSSRRSCKACPRL